MSAAQMEKHLFNLKFASKQLLRDSKKCEKEEKAEKLKLKKAIEKGNMEVARIHAENAIRQKNQVRPHRGENKKKVPSPSLERWVPIKKSTNYRSLISIAPFLGYFHCAVLFFQSN